MGCRRRGFTAWTAYPSSALGRRNTCEPRAALGQAVFRPQSDDRSHTTCPSAAQGSGLYAPGYQHRPLGGLSAAATCFTGSPLVHPLGEGQWGCYGRLPYASLRVLASTWRSAPGRSPVTRCLRPVAPGQAWPGQTGSARQATWPGSRFRQAVCTYGLTTKRHTALKLSCTAHLNSSCMRLEISCAYS